VEAARLEKRLAELRVQVADLRDLGGMLPVDPQAELLSKLLSGWVVPSDIGASLAALLAVVIELVSALGPVVLVGYAERTRTLPKAHVTPPNHQADDVMRFMATHIGPAVSNHEITRAELYRAYRSWTPGSEARTRDDFLAVFKISVARLQLPVQKTRDGYGGVALLTGPR
jgi:hypothetical protein